MATLPNDGASVFSSITQPKRGRETHRALPETVFGGIWFPSESCPGRPELFHLSIGLMRPVAPQLAIPTFPEKLWDPSILKVDYPLPTNLGKKQLEEFGCFGNPRVF